MISLNHNDFEASLVSQETFQGLDEQLQTELLKIVSVVLNIAEKNNIPLSCSELIDDGFGDIALICCIKTDDPSYLSELNNLIIEKMIERAYETGRCVAFFVAS